MEGQELRDEFQNFQKKNTIILGISADSVTRQKNFCTKHEFPYQLLSDPDKETIRAYKAIGMKKMYGKEYEGILRISYLIDESGMFFTKWIEQAKIYLEFKSVIESVS